MSIVVIDAAVLALIQESLETEDADDLVSRKVSLKELQFLGTS